MPEGRSLDGEDRRTDGRTNVGARGWVSSLCPSSFDGADSIPSSCARDSSATQLIMIVGEAPNGAGARYTAVCSARSSRASMAAILIHE
jgi:hypothetical protein